MASSVARVRSRNVLAAWATGARAIFLPLITTPVWFGLRGTTSGGLRDPAVEISQIVRAARL